MIGEKMVKSFIRLVNELSEAESKTKKEQLSHEASAALSRRKDQVDYIIVPIIEQLEMSDSIDGFKDITQGEFYELDVRPYYNENSVLKVSIQMSFLQDFENDHDDIDERIGLYIYNELFKRNLDTIVNDICINDVQYINGTKN